MFKMPKWSADNPLGIIALFISLIYGMSALLLAASVDSLEPHNETILVVFTVIFPFVVLGVFGWLVANHHKKLYGPKDFKSDEGFLIAADSEPASLGERLKREVEEDLFEDRLKEGEADAHADDEIHDTASDERQTEDVKPLPSVSDLYLSKPARDAYMMESLVFQELQRDIGGSVRREVHLVDKNGKKIRADGVIEKGESKIIVEVKHLRTSSHAMRIRKAFEQMQDYRRLLKGSSETPVRFMLVFIVDSNSAPLNLNVRSVLKQLSSHEDVDCRVFEYSDLMSKYGFSEDQTEDQDNG